MPRPAGMPQLSSIGARVRWWRDYRKMSRKELARLANLGYSTLADLENGEQASSKNMHLIAAALRLNPHYLETGKGEPEAEFAQEPPIDAPAWPFEISKSKIDRLNNIELQYLETKLFKALNEIDAARRKSRTG